MRNKNAGRKGLTLITTIRTHAHAYLTLLHIASFFRRFCELLLSILFAPTLCCFSLYAIHAPAIALYALCFTRYPLQYDGRRTTRITFAILLVLRPQYTLYDGRRKNTLTPQRKRFYKITTLENQKKLHGMAI